MTIFMFLEYLLIWLHEIETFQSNLSEQGLFLASQVQREQGVLCGVFIQVKYPGVALYTQQHTQAWQQALVPLPWQLEGVSQLWFSSSTHVCLYNGFLTGYLCNLMIVPSYEFPTMHLSIKVTLQVGLTWYMNVALNVPCLSCIRASLQQIAALKGNHWHEWWHLLRPMAIMLEQTHKGWIKITVVGRVSCFMFNAAATIVQ